jgi:hypothetical protein
MFQFNLLEFPPHFPLFLGHIFKRGYGKVVGRSLDFSIGLNLSAALYPLG